MEAMSAVSTAIPFQSQAEQKNAPKDQGAAFEHNQVLKEEQLVNQLAQQNSQSNATEGPAKQVTAAATVEKKAMTEQKSQVSSSRTPNWSLLSAQVKGYTQLQRAMNLYQNINNLG